MSATVSALNDPPPPRPSAAGAPSAEADCSIARSLEVMGDRWTILIMRDAFRGIRRFDDFRSDLGIARPVLADRLKKLVDAGVMVRRQYQAHPPRFEYRLTPMGIELSPALVALMRWGDRWLNEGAPPTVLVHEHCGSELEQGFWCRTCRKTFKPTEIASIHPHDDAESDTESDTDAETDARTESAPGGPSQGDA
ncbi:MAG: helix-turn-helix transcriptional regulator [Actinobacteria bacterium]|nr:helix-turn-helix transcriptional regulator [Actinomycetota bacterium]